MSSYPTFSTFTSSIAPIAYMSTLNANKSALNTGLIVLASCNLTKFRDTSCGFRDIGGHCGTFWDA